MEEGKRKGMIRQKGILFLLVLLFISGYLLYFFLMQEEIMKQSKFSKVLIIGIDGMDPRVAQYLMDQDKLPNFKKLAKTGSFLKLNTSYPPNSPVAWTSISTGRNPGKHNIFDFIRRNPENYIPELSLSRSKSGIGGTEYSSYVRANPFWKKTSTAGIPTTVMRWPVTFPAEKVKGKMLSGLGVPDIKGFLSGFTFYTSKKEITSKKSSSRIMEVEVKNNVINTKILGPRVKKDKDIVDVELPMKIEMHNDSVDLFLNNKKYNIQKDNWSEWIRAEFPVGIFHKVNSIFKVYISSLNPFDMYMTTMQIDPERPVVDISYPKNYSRYLTQRIGFFYTLGMPEETDGYVDDKLSEEAFLAQVGQIEDERNSMFWNEFNEFQRLKKGVLAFVYDSSDRLQHLFWDEKIFSNTKEKFQINQNIINYYIEKDKFLGKVIQALDDKTLLLLLSDHGFTSFERAVSINTWLVENGFMVLKKKLAEGEDGALFRYVDWSRTKAYSVGFNSIYVNLKGREGQGIVSDKNEVIDELVKRLEGFIDKDTQRNVVNKAYRREEIYNGDYVIDAPDIIIGFNPGYRMAWETAIGGFSKDALYDNIKKWRGDHLVDPKFVPGVLFSNVKFSVDTASQMDVTPTIYNALGIEIPDDIDGRSLLK